MRTIDHRSFKDELYAEFARIGAAVSSPKRLEIVDLLAQRERTVEDLAREIGLSVANASRHLRILAGARLLTSRRAGTFVCYRLSSPSVFRLFRSLRDLAAQRLPEVDAIVHRYTGARDGVVDATAPNAVSARVRAGRAFLVDVRPQAEYRAGHFPGARPLPLDAMRRRGALRALPSDREIIVCCRGPYCVWADEAVALLRRRGYKARRLLLGPADWAALGGELEATPEAAS